jgi:hypothetical protein
MTQKNIYIIYICIILYNIFKHGSIYHRIESNSNMNLIAIIGIDKELGSEKPNGRRWRSKQTWISPWLETLISDLKTKDLATEDRHVKIRFASLGFTTLLLWKENKNTWSVNHVCNQSLYQSVHFMTNIGLNMNPSTNHSPHLPTIRPVFFVRSNGKDGIAQIQVFLGREIWSAAFSPGPFPKNRRSWSETKMFLHVLSRSKFPLVQDSRRIQWQNKKVIVFGSISWQW